MRISDLDLIALGLAGLVAGPVTDDWLAAVSVMTLMVCVRLVMTNDGLFVLPIALAFHWMQGNLGLIYYGLTLGGPASATIGMRMVDLEMRTWYGAPAYFVLGAVHAIGYWLTVTFLTPFILLVALFNDRRRLLHDMLVGTIVINNPARAEALRRGLSPVQYR